MTRQIFARIAGSCILALAASTAHADPIASWDYSVGLTWSTAPGDVTWSNGNDGQRSTSATVLQWGGSLNNYTNTNSGQSALVITGSPADGTAITDGGPELTNTITHYNNVVSSNLKTLTSAVLLADVTLTPLGGSPLAPYNYQFQIKFVETPNTARTCVPDSATVCDDIFVLAMGALNKEFTVGDYTYYVSIFEATNALNPLSKEACERANATWPCIGFMTPEQQHTPAQFAFQLTSEPVTVDAPAPGVLALMGIGLAGAGFLRRRRRD